MKNKINLLSLATLLFLTFQCSDERIEPQLSEDLKTSATAYADQFLTIEITTTADDKHFEFGLNAYHGAVTVNWGDGTIQKNVWIADAFVTLSHHYANQKNYSIVVSGPIDQITDFFIEDQNLKVRSVHLGGMPELRTLILENLLNGPQAINLSRNRKIEYVSTSRTTSLTDIILPTTNRLIGLDITGNNNLTTSVVDRLVARVHDSVVNSPRSGLIYLRSGIEGEASNKMIGPPSSYTINKLRKLHNVYGWNVIPGIQ